MKAAILGPRGLELADIAAPQPSDDDVLVRVRAAALNHADLGVLAGHMHGAVGGPGTVLGLEWAGEVIAVGRRVTHVRVGDRVMGSGRGALAEQAISDGGRVLPLPRADMPFDEAAALPVALQTLHDALATNGQLRAGQSVLIQGASSGVGLMGLRMARVLGAAMVIGSSRDAARRAKLLKSGADLAIDTSDPAWPEQVRAATGGRGVDLVVDMLSGATVNAAMGATAIGGRIVNVGRLAGQHASFDFDLHALRRIQYIGVTFRTRSVAQVREVVQRMRTDLWPALQAGQLSLPIAARFPLQRTGEAFALLAAKTHFGKIVVNVAP
jgi:NADPH2:quinone reductase